MQSLTDAPPAVHSDPEPGSAFFPDAYPDEAPESPDALWYEPGPADLAWWSEQTRGTIPADVLERESQIGAGLATRLPSDPVRRSMMSRALSGWLAANRGGHE